MKFILQLARRELRASWRRLLFFFACIAIGVGAIVAGRSMLQNASVAIASEARNLLTADVQVDSNRPWPPETLATIDRISQPLADARTETIESPTMIRPADGSREGAMMIELKGIDSAFPLVGEFKLANGEPFSYSLIQNNGAVVSVALLDRLELQIGDEVKIGNSTFQIRGSIEREPGGGSGFRVGPRVFLERAAVESAGLTGFGSRARRKIFFTTPEDKVAALSRQLRDELKNNLVNVRSYKESQENLSEQFSRAEDYSSLTGLVILVLGGIGISNVTRVFIEQKKKSIAVLKCVGATGTRITIAYLAQVVTMGAVGSILGLLFGRVVLLLIQHIFADKLPAYMTYGMRAGRRRSGIGRRHFDLAAVFGASAAAHSAYQTECAASRRLRGGSRRARPAEMVHSRDSSPRLVDGRLVASGFNSSRALFSCRTRRYSGRAVPLGNVADLSCAAHAAPHFVCLEAGD